MHWMSAGASSTDPTRVVDEDDINVYWQVTIPPKSVQSYMMVLVQNRWSIKEAIENATFIDSNPLKIYDGKFAKKNFCIPDLTHFFDAGLSSDILSTLQNFNACAAEIPSVTVSQTSACTVAGGKATFSVSNYDLSFPLLAVYSDDTQVDVTTTTQLPEGTFDVVLKLYPGCESKIFSGSVTCPASPVTPVVNQPSSKVSDSSKVGVAATVILSFLLL